MSNNLSPDSKGLLRASSLYAVGILLVLSLTIYNTAAHAQSQTASHPSTGILPAIQITSPTASQQVPPGELTIQGISSDNEDTDCMVYADVNDKTPMQNVSAAGDSKKVNDFSKWSFTYTPEYQLIKPGENELTAKITCLNERNPSADAFHLMSASAAPLNSSPPLSKWHTVNVTGITGAPSVSPASSPSPPAENADDLQDEIEESDEEEINNEEDIDVVDIDVVDVADEEDSSDGEGNNNDEQNDDGIDEDSSEDDSDNSNGDIGDSFFSGDPFFDE